MRASTWTAILAILAGGILITASSGAFGVLEVTRDADIGISASSDTLLDIDAASDVSVACSEELVTVTNTHEEQMTVTVSLVDSNDGELKESEDGPNMGMELSFDLDVGEDRTVYISNVQGPVSDDVEFTISATTESETSISRTVNVPKSPGNEDDDGDDEDENEGDNDC